MRHAFHFALLAFLAAALLIAGCGQETPGAGHQDPARRTEVLEDAPPPIAAPLMADGGESEYQIVLPAGASASEERAAEQLKSCFEACTGVALPVVNAAERDPAAPMLLLGCGELARELGVDPAQEALGEQGYVMRTVEPHLVIAGTPAAGTMYGVYDFLETYLGVKWYAPHEKEVPEHNQVALPDVDTLVKPAIPHRNTSYAWPGADADFRSFMRDNAGGRPADHPYGVGYGFDGKCHTYFRYVSPGAYFDEHPEYFSEIGGIRRREETQLCLTNPEVFEIVLEKILKRMEERPNDRQHNFSQMDYYNYCECEECSRINEQYGTTGGTQFWFVNKLAEETSKVYPDKQVGTLAYTYTEKPPEGMTMHPNVAVWLCHMYPSCQSHPIETCPLNADYKKRAQGWSEICQHVYIWHYIVDFAHYYTPYPNFRALAADLRFYRDIGIEGIYLQAMGHGGGGGEFSLLRPYYAMKLAWNPDQDAEALIREFLAGYYGAAAEPIHEYISLIHDKVMDEDIHMHLYTNPAQGYLPDEVIARADELFDQAEAAVAGDEKLLDRVKVARLPILYAKLFPRNGYTIEGDSLKFVDYQGSVEMANTFIERMKEHGFKTIRERGGDPSQMAMWAAAMQLPLPLARIENEHLLVQAAPFLGGRVLRIVHKESGECATAYNVVRNLFFPFSGGEETRLGGTFTVVAGGNMALFETKEHTETRLVMETEAMSFKIRRAIELAPDAPELRFETTITNDTDKPRSTNIRSHMELDMGELQETRVSFTARNGEKVDKDMTDIIAGLREGEHYYDQTAPKGSWTFTGTEGLKLVQSFDDEMLDFAWLYAYPDYLNELEVELWANPVTLEPGQSAALSHTVRVEKAGQ